MADEFKRYSGEYLAIIERDGWEYASRTNAHGVAVIVPVTDSGQLVLVEQYRIPVNRRVVELPAGLVGDGNDPGESLADGARRELAEETGFRASRMTLLCQCPSSAGLSDEMVTFFLAGGLRRDGPGGGDPTEDIEVHLVDLANVDSWLAQRESGGVYLDPKIWTALYWLDKPDKWPANA